MNDPPDVSKPGLSSRTSERLEQLEEQLAATKDQLRVALDTISQLTRLLDAARSSQG